jgi:endo-1,4-beta-xylanase
VRRVLADLRSGRRRRSTVTLLALLLLVTAAARSAVAADTLRQAAVRAGVLVGVGREAGNPADDRLAVREFDAMTLENSLIWSVVQPAPGSWDFRRADRSVAFARRHHLFLTATHFVWDQVFYQSTPAWVKRITSRKRLEAVMESHLATITHRYGRAINRWIVVNEPLRYFGDTGAIQPNVFSRVLGPDWIADSFRIAHRAAPHAQLWLNEIFTETDRVKADALVRIASSLVRQHVPIDGVALQGHLFVPLRPVAPDTSLVLRTLRRLAALGLKVSLTEIDAPTLPGPGRLTVQASRMRALVTQCLAVRRCTSVTFWDLLDSESWLNNLFGRADLAPTLFDAARHPHPAYFAVRDALLEASRRPR